MVKKFSYDKYGFEIVVNKFAQQANGAVWFQQGGTVILATAVSSPSKEFPGFFPLTIDYREHYSAAGKIPGGYYKREGKSSDREVLTSRLIDRALRPLFPEKYFDQVQILVNVFSVDKEHTPNTIALIAASLALTLSDIPAVSPVGAVEIARVNGEWIIAPKYEQIIASDVRLVVAGTQEGLCMVEGSLNEVQEDEVVDLFFKAHEEIKQIVQWQKNIQQEVGKTKQSSHDVIDWSVWENRVSSYLTEEHIATVFVQDKVERSNHITNIKESFISDHAQMVTNEGISSTLVDYIFDQVFKDKVTTAIFKRGERVDGRAFDQVRHIETEVDLLPYTHGSALFTRGRTQALISVTLGGGQDEQRIESLMGTEDDSGSFMLHYNFPPYSVGEVRPLRGPGRREVGHGHLAASALRYMLPNKEQFPYTIRVVADMLESDGSTSMATTCGTTMALMQAGVPIKRMVSGVAMGLLMGDNNAFQVLTDLSGFEDAYGMMDFKVTGTDQGITAIQMDIKYKGGLSRQVFEKALHQAKEGRAYILGEMRKVMTVPRTELSPLVPKLVSFKINTDKIGAVIGSGGKTIREIIEKTGTTIDIESDGLVKIFGSPGAQMDTAINWVKTLAGQIEVGTTYQGKIRRIVEFGMFVELVPGLDGLVHVSNIPRDKQRSFAQAYAVDDMLTVQVLDYDAAAGRIKLRIVEDNK